MIINTSPYPLPASYAGVSKLQDQFNVLQGQLATGDKATNLADLGTSRYTDLTVRARLNRLGGFDANIKTVNLRLGVIDQVLDTVSQVNTDARTASTPAYYGTNDINLQTAPSTAGAQLDQVLTGLNTDLNGHYLFGGGVVDTPPVATTDEIMNGTASKAGFKTVAAERLQADQGADGLGRLTVTNDTTATPDTVTLAEDGSHPFGSKLDSLGTNSTAVSLTQPTGTPPSLSVKFDSLPADGDTVTIGLKLPDGTTDTVSMKAVSGTPANPGEFQIGASADETAANFGAALTSSLQADGQTKLAVASNYAAANNFFNGQGEDIQRVAKDPVTNSYATATGFEDAATTAADTVQWYKGEDSDGQARASVTTKVDDNTSVNYGVEANESGFVNLIRGLAVQSIQTYPTTTDAETAVSKAKFDAVATGLTTTLSATNDSKPGSIASIGVDLGLTQTTMKNISDRHSAYSAQLQDVIGDAETADPTEVASALLELQTRLSASYSAISMISQLQLVNYLK